MIHFRPFEYSPSDNESEKASNSYLMALLAFMAGVPFPVVNLIATLIFFLGNRKSSYFVRWHCTQALLAQLSVILMNSVGFWWTISILFYDDVLTNRYVAYMITVVLFNLTEIIFTIITAVNVRKQVHVEWWLFGPLTHQLCRK